MSLIVKRDTNGVKPLLQTGEFGYDNYPAGGDSGRVYVGTGSENIPLAKKAELNAKADNTDADLLGIPKAPTAAVGTNSAQLATTAFVGAEIADKAYSKTQLDAGQLDNRYYTETEIDTKLAEQNEASEISYDGTVSELVATNVQDAIDEVEDRLDTAEGAVADANLTRADKYLASQNIAKMVYTNGDLTKIQYKNATDADYEVFTYSGGDLSGISHYVGGILKGNSVLLYTNGDLTSVIFTGV